MDSDRSSSLSEIPEDAENPEGYLPLPAFVTYGNPRWPEDESLDEAVSDDTFRDYTRNLKWWPRTRLTLVQRMKRGLRRFVMGRKKDYYR